MKCILVIPCMLLHMVSCTSKDENAFTENAASTKDTLVRARVTVLSELPDSLQPKVSVLNKMPKPLTVQIPKGNPVLDKKGTPLLRGDGGISYFTNFIAEEDFLPGGVHCSILDSRGYLWFGTQGGGVCLYDGQTSTIFTSSQGLANNIVFSIAEDKAGNIWFGTFGGICRFDGRRFTTYNTDHGLAGNNVTSLVFDRQGSLWIGTLGDGVSRFDGTSFTTFTTADGLADNTVNSIVEDNNGNLWFATLGGGVSCYNGRAFANYSTAQGLASNWVLCATVNRDGNLWFGTQGGGACYYDGKAFTNYSTDAGLASNTVCSILEDREGNLWFGTLENGVSRFNGKSFSTFTAAEGLGVNWITGIVEDRSGNLWFCGMSGGVSRYNGRSFTIFNNTLGLPGTWVYCMTQDKAGNYWFGTNGGLSRYNGSSFTNLTTAQGLPENHVLSVHDDKNGRLWVGTYGGGVSCFDGTSFTTYTTAQGLAGNWIHCITEDKKGNLWFGSLQGNGVSCYDGKSFTNYSTAQGLNSNQVAKIIQDRNGNLWIATWGGGLSRYDGMSFTNFTTDQGLADNTVLSIAEDNKGNIWVGTQEGLSVMSASRGKKADDGQLRIFKNFTTTDGLPDNYIYQVVQLPNGKIAIGTNLGIAFFTPSADLTELSGIEIFNSETGCPIKDVNGGPNGIYIDNHGIIWVCTGFEKTTLIRFDPSALRTSTEPPILVINRIKLNEENISWYALHEWVSDTQQQSVGGNREMAGITTPASITEEYSRFGRLLNKTERSSMLERYADLRFDSISKFYPVPQNLVLPYRHNKITFDFVAVDVDNPKMVRYQHILEGYDKEWSPELKTASATFGNIREGTYTFKVKACGSNGIWCEPVSFTFEVLPPVHRTWWAYVSYLILFALVLWSFVKWRLRALKQKHDVLEKTVLERTSELVAQKREVEKQKERSEELLLNILPYEVAEELKATGAAKTKTFSLVTVMFMDFKDFTAISEKVSAELLVDEINYCFSSFDMIIQKYGVEKIKTVGDAYICAGGIPVLNYTHATDVVRAALEIRDFMLERKKEKERKGEIPFELRLGIHTGPVVAGIVGKKKFQYDIWGDTVNLAARMEQNSEAGEINISASTYKLVKDKFNCAYRGKIAAKNLGQVEMYFVETNSKNPTLHNTPS